MAASRAPKAASAHPEALAMRDAEDLATVVTEVDEPNAERRLDLAGAEAPDFPFAMRAQWDFAG